MFQSAVVFLHGFAPEVDIFRLLAVEMAPNNTVYETDGSPVQSSFLSTHSVSYGQQSSVIRDRLAVHRIAKRLGVTVNELPRLSNIFDIMMTHFCHGMIVELYAPRDEADLHTVASIRVLHNG